MRKLPVTRRDLLGAGLALGGGLIVGPVGKLRAQSRVLAGVRVIVIGAGISGLASARTLVDAGAEVIVLEAKPHIGGRLVTDMSMGAPFELGAGWIHGPSAGNPIVKLARASGARTVVTDDDSLTVFRADGEEVSDAGLEAIDTGWEALLEAVDDEVDPSDRQSLAEVIARISPGALSDPGLRWALSAYTEFSKGAAIEDLSAALFDADEAFPGDDVVVINGYDRILGPLAAELDIRLSIPVHRVVRREDGVSVETDRGPLTADYVVSSLPLGVLKAETVAFDPPLPEAFRTSIATLGFGSVTKIALKFAAPFWDIGTQYFGVMTDPKGRWNYWLNYRTFSDQNILLGLSVGAYAPVADRMSDAAMAEDALEVLRGVWGSDVGVPIDMRATHWSTDPETLGAYTYPTPNSRRAQFDGFAAPVDGRLFLCGEHTMFDYAGTTHGAYLSGIRAAELVIKEEA